MQCEKMLLRCRDDPLRTDQMVKEHRTKIEDIEREILLADIDLEWKAMGHERPQILWPGALSPFSPKLECLQECMIRNGSSKDR